ncbi:MAG TPA: hypothetical protein VJK52_01780 [Candidatus Nanoarchaeia archaeon]|nr:hypothetical protein [Candidatus Nanoarchaeia archaeon]
MKNSTPMRQLSTIITLLLLGTTLPLEAGAASATRQEAICKRIEKSVQANRLDKINERLQTRLGFQCNFSSVNIEEGRGSTDANTSSKQAPKKAVSQKGGTLPYTFPATSDWKSHWNVYTGEIPNEVSYYLDNVEMAEDSSDQFPQFVRIHFPKGTGSPHVAHNFGKKAAGILARFTGGIPAGQDDMYLRYYFRIPKNYPMQDNPRLPGFFGGLVTEPDGRGRFDANIFLNKEGRIDTDGAYKQDYRAKGNPVSQQVVTADNKWHRIDMRVVLNDVPDKGSIPHNGTLEVWIDGAKGVLRDGIVFRTNEKYVIDGLYLDLLFGSTKVNDLVKEDTHLDFADITVSDEPIGQ